MAKKIIKKDKIDLMNRIIEGLWTKFNAVNINKKGWYTIKRRILTKIFYANKRMLHIKSSEFWNKLNAKYAELTKEGVNNQNIYKYIEYIETLNVNDTLPHKLVKIDDIARSQYKVEKYKLYKQRLEKNESSAKLIPKIIGSRIENQSQITNDIITSQFSRYHAKWIKKMQKMKKYEVYKNDSKYVIDLQNVVKYYANKYVAFKVLKDINLQIKKGEFVVIIGPSGSGKTTLMNLISGMDTATLGKTIVSGENLINKNNTQLTTFRKNNIGYVFQQYGLLPNLTVKENIELGASLQSDESKRMDINEIMKTLGIFEYKNKMPYELSGGQQQRVSIARSIVKNPQLLFGDEPTGAIDEKMSKQIMQLFIDVNKKYKTTILIVTHNPIIAKLASKVIVVENGTIAKIIDNKKTKNVDEIKW